jgi:hypothetical protein
VSATSVITRARPGYNYAYNTSTLTDNGGIKINQVFIGNIPANLNLDVKLYALAPMLLWVSD